MKKSFKWLLIIPLLLISPTLAADHFEMTYAGSINDTIKIHMKLKCDGEALTGSYYYDKVQINIPLQGKIDKLNKITLNEYGEPEKITGIFEGILVSRIKIQGDWSAPNSSKRMPFELKAIDIKAPSSKTTWAGDRVRTGSRGVYGGCLSISKVMGKSFYFELNANNGGATGEISGEAVITSNNRAVWQDREPGGRIEFILFDDLIVVETENCHSYGGYGVFFDGDYRSGVEKTRFSLLDLGVFTNETQEEAFQKLVGADYEYLVDTFGSYAAEDDLDGFGAKAYRSWIRGLGGFYDIILMFTPEGKLWVAKMFMDYQNSGADVIKYYTNDSKYYSKLPRTIEKWKTEVIGRDLKVIYGSH